MAGETPAAVLLKSILPLINHNAQHDLVFVQHKLQSSSTDSQQVSMHPKFWLHNMLGVTCLM